MFKIKDLMINIAPAADAAQGQFAPLLQCTVSCGYWSFPCHPRTFCNFHTCRLQNSNVVERVGAAEIAGAQAAFCFTGTIAPCGALSHCLPYTTQPPCRFFSVIPCGIISAVTCQGCSLFITIPCPLNTVIGPNQPFGPGPVEMTEQVATLKAQLRQALAEVEKEQQALDESLRPQTVAEVEQLQAKLKDAMAELDNRKLELQKRPEKSTKSS